MQPIESKKNPYIKFARKLHRKKSREKESLFLMEGFRSLQEVSHANYPVHTLYYCPGIRDLHQQILIEILCKRAENTFVISEEMMKYISPSKSPQKVLAILPKKKWDKADVIQKGKYFIGLYRVSDPGNVGAIIRSARAFNCGGIILIDDCVDPYNPKSVRSSAGYIVSTPIIFEDDLKNFFLTVYDNDLISIAVTPKSETLFFPVPLEGKTVYVLGGEAYGLDEDFIDFFQDTFRIPMVRDVESLNLAVCASIVLNKVYEKSITITAEEYEIQKAARDEKKG